MKIKPTVHYNIDGVVHIVVGQQATVNAIDHYKWSIYSNQMIATSVVLCYDESTGIFETKNSIYVPMKLDA